MTLIFEALQMIRRNAVVSSAAAVVVFLSSFILGVLSYVVLNFSAFATAIGEQTCIEAYLMDGVNEEKSAFLVRAAEMIEGVDSVKYISSADAVERLGKTDASLNLLIDMDLLHLVPASIEVRVKSPKDVGVVADILDGYDGVDFVRYGDDISAKAMEFVSAGKTTCAFLLVFLSVCTVLSVATTTVLVAIGKERDIETMRLLGADTWFIAKPFVMQGVILGGVSAFAAWLVMRILGATLSFGDSLLSFVPVIHLIYTIGFWLILAGMFFGGAGALIAILCTMRQR